MPVTALSPTATSAYGVIRRGAGDGGQQGGREAGREKRGVLRSRRHEQARIILCDAQRHAEQCATQGSIRSQSQKEGAETLRVTIAGRFTAAPGDNSRQ
ncbi:MAG: hypothetical protein ACLTG0_15185 [Oscillibacter sp.]